MKLGRVNAITGYVEEQRTCQAWSRGGHGFIVRSGEIQWEVNNLREVQLIFNAHGCTRMVVDYAISPFLPRPDLAKLKSIGRKGTSSHWCAPVID